MNEREDLLELEISTVAHGGVFVARTEGRVVFVSDTLPGERVLARLSDQQHDSYWRAETVEVLEPSEHRQDHIWAEAAVTRAPDERPGGAEFGHIDLAEQRALKTQVLRENLSRMGGITSFDAAIDPTVVAVPGNADGTGWRTRVRLHVDEDGTVGPYGARSHKVISVGSLPLATAAVQEAAPLKGAFAHASAIDLVQSADGTARLIEVPKPVARPAQSAPRRLSKGARGSGPRRPPAAPAAAPQAAPKPQTIVEKVGDRQFQLDLSGFWQVHPAAAQTLSWAVQEAIDEALFDPRAHNLDLYGGVGMLAAAVGDRFGTTTRITSVESDAVATDYAAENLADWVGAQALTERVDRFLSKLENSASASDRKRLAGATVVLDPPRSGAGKQVVRSLVALKPAQIVYVACDPVALSRDVGAFSRAGYEMRSLRAFDLFPHTHHLEAVALLVPA